MHQINRNRVAFIDCQNSKFDSLIFRFVYFPIRKINLDLLEPRKGAILQSPMENISSDDVGASNHICGIMILPAFTISLPNCVAKTARRRDSGGGVDFFPNWNSRAHLVQNTLNSQFKISKFPDELSPLPY